MFDPELLNIALKAVNSNKKFAFATVIESTKKGTPQKEGAKMLVCEDGTLYGTIGGGRNEHAAQKECLKAIKSKKAKLVTYEYYGKKGQSICGGKIHVFIEPFIGIKKLIICGGGHIALPLSIAAKMLDYHVTILDPRKTFANKKRFSHVDEVIVGPYKTKLSKIEISSNTSIVIVTHGNEHDYQCLHSIIESDAEYIGVISSKAKKVKFIKRLKELGLPQKLINKVHIPAGVDLGAQTPSEIAISISAEMVKQTNKNFLKSGKFLDKIKPFMGKK